MPADPASPAPWSAPPPAALWCACERTGNPIDYLTAIQKHAERVREEPAKWLPWNYQDQLKAPLADTG